MNFGPVPVADAVGAILAHSVRLDGRRLRKGVVLTARDVSALARGGHSEVTVARLTPQDCAEDKAAQRLAARADEQMCQKLSTGTWMGKSILIQ
mgnify:CR=1 FL=1